MTQRPDPTATDWEVDGIVADGLPAGWRRHARAAHLALFDRWVGAVEGRWLKTDLQEERSPARSLLPSLPGAWFGIDVAVGVIAGAALGGLPAAVSDVRALPFADGSFRGILSTSTLDHFDVVTDIDVSLRELCRVLARGGTLVLTLDNPQNPLIWLRNALPERSRTGLLAPFHVGPTLSEAKGRAALERAGFGVLATEHLLHAPHIIGTRSARWPWAERRALPWFDRLAGTRLARYSGHYVAFLATPRE